jgi:acyl-CoA thioesterase
MKPAMQVVAIIHHQQLLAGSIPVNSTTTTIQFSREFDFDDWDWNDDDDF